MNAEWYYSDDQSADNRLVDSFKDSKFSMDRWNSFAREIVQNSIDARDDENTPVKVVFELNKSLTIADIPGGDYLKTVLGQCMDAVSNKQTKGSYKKGLEILNNDYIYCLKISDYNTKGVESGRDKAWGAFVFDEGKSVKQRPGSAGSHGVGKKVPFIISTCNTVFYSTKNKYYINGEEYSDCLVQGKTQLTNWWDKSGIKKSDKGWFGVVDRNENPENRIKPIDSSFDEIHPYFVRKDELGTDVIIVGVNVYKDEEEVKIRIINAIISNFFIALRGGSLEVNVMGVEINKSNFNYIFNKYYKPSDNYGNDIQDCINTLVNEPSDITIKDKTGEVIGNIKIYFQLQNSQNRKYYTIVRSHGMRITDNRINSADQPYTAVVYVEGVELNRRLSELENAAHDNFITDDDDIEIPAECIYAYEVLKEKVRDFIIEKTKIDDMEPQKIEDLNNIIVIPGSFAVINKKDSKPTVKRNPVKKKTKGKNGQSFEKGKGQEGGGKKKQKKKVKGRKPAEDDGNSKSVIYNNYIVDPFFVKSGKDYILAFQASDDINNAEMVISSINSDEKSDSSISDFISHIIIDSKKYKVVDGKVKNIDLIGGKIYKINVSMKRDVIYQMKVSVSYKEAKKCE